MVNTKKIAYAITAIFYYIFYLFPINKNKILLIPTHDDSWESNIGVTHTYFHENNPDLVFVQITREDYNFKTSDKFSKFIKIFIKLPYYIATSYTIFMDNVFLPFSMIKPKSDTRIVQLWHGTGTIKKFGLDTEEGWIKEAAVKVNNRTTHYTVSSTWMREIYKTAFTKDVSKIYVTGSPRTDIFFQKDMMGKKQEFYELYPELKDKQLLLYAPTLRDNDNNVQLNIKYLLDNIGPEYVVGIRLHPHIVDQIDVPLEDNLINFSSYSNLNTLLFAADVLITDYSSIIFEYGLLNKPMIFCTPDLDEFKKDGRGFYENYEEIVPGKIVYNTEELVDQINSPIKVDLTSFRDKYLEICDGHSTERLYELLF